MGKKIPELTHGDTEIGVIVECYKSLKMLDRDAQNRALNWLHARLEDDTIRRSPAQQGADTEVKS
jgi:hypothetical protein